MLRAAWYLMLLYFMMKVFLPLIIEFNLVENINKGHNYIKYSLKIKNISTLLNIFLITFGIIVINWENIPNSLFMIAVGLLYLPLMVLLTSSGRSYIQKYSFRIIKWGKFIANEYKLTALILIQTLEEELIWRSALVFILLHIGISVEWSVVIGSVMFYLIHLRIKNGKIVILTELEFALFTIILYLIYIKYNTIVITWGVHFMRNSYIRFYKSETGCIDEQYM